MQRILFFFMQAWFLIGLSAALYAHAMPPPENPLPHQVNEATLICEARGQQIRVLDARKVGLPEVKPEPAKIELGRVLELELKVQEIIYSRHSLGAGTLKVIIRFSYYSVQQVRQQLLGKELIYLLRSTPHIQDKQAGQRLGEYYFITDEYHFAEPLNTRESIQQLLEDRQDKLKREAIKKAAIQISPPKENEAMVPLPGRYECILYGPDIMGGPSLSTQNSPLGSIRLKADHTYKNQGQTGQYTYEPLTGRVNWLSGPLRGYITYSKCRSGFPRLIFPKEENEKSGIALKGITWGYLQTGNKIKY